jgi:hypothetical protein
LHSFLPTPENVAEPSFAVVIDERQNGVYESVVFKQASEKRRKKFWEEWRRGSFERASSREQGS